jgi:hypothetical protein
MKKKLLLMALIALWAFQGNSQIRTKGANYLEVMGGKPLLLDNGNFTTQAGEGIYGLSYAIGSIRGNYHRLNFSYRKEFVKSLNTLSQASNYENFTLKYSYESTLTKGRNHLSYLGLLYGLGVGIENLNRSYNTNLQSSTAYPLATLGLNFEKFLGTSVALFIRVDGDATMMAISQKLKGNVGIGLKVKL